MPTTIKSASTDPSFSGSYSRAVAVTLSDSTDLSEPCRAINVHKSGATSVAVKVTMLGDTTPVTLNIAEATTLPVRCSRIWSTGTDVSATIVALY